MDIGKLNCRITITEKLVTRNEFGEEEVIWRPAKYLWARITPISGTEYFHAEHVQAEVTTTFIIRYDPCISVLNRVTYKDKNYEILGVFDKDTEHKATILNCKEIVHYGV